MQQRNVTHILYSIRRSDDSFSLLHSLSKRPFPELDILIVTTISLSAVVIRFVE